jgi:DNA-binding LacI/PurR family transcriptional regulator
VPASEWVETLLAADLDRAAIGGVIVNDPEADSVAKAIFLLRYAAYAPPQDQRAVRDIAADNAIYDLLRPDSVDGLIVVSSLLSTYSGARGVARLVERFAGATMCSVGIDLPGVPSLVLDNRPGMEAVVEHLVRDHGCRQIAFLAWTPENPEAKSRFDAYQAVLARHGIASDPALTAPGYFRTNSAKVAMEEILARGVEIDGVVAANDEMATGAVDVLRKHGRRVPQDIPVTGFDDLLLARLGNPPLQLALLIDA